MAQSSESEKDDKLSVWRLAMRLVMKTKVAKAKASPRMTHATTADARKERRRVDEFRPNMEPGCCIEERTEERVYGCCSSSPFPGISHSKPSGRWLPARRFAAFARTGDAEGICCATSCAMLETLGEEDLEPVIVAQVYSNPRCPLSRTLSAAQKGTVLRRGKA